MREHMAANGFEDIIDLTDVKMGDPSIRAPPTSKSMVSTTPAAPAATVPTAALTPSMPGEHIHVETAGSTLQPSTNRRDAGRARPSGTQEHIAVDLASRDEHTAAPVPTIRLPIRLSGKTLPLPICPQLNSRPSSKPLIVSSRATNDRSTLVDFEVSAANSATPTPDETTAGENLTDLHHPQGRPTGEGDSKTWYQSIARGRRTLQFNNMCSYPIVLSSHAWSIALPRSSRLLSRHPAQDVDCQDGLQPQGVKHICRY